MALLSHAGSTKSLRRCWGVEPAPPCAPDTPPSSAGPGGRGGGGGACPYCGDARRCNPRLQLHAAPQGANLRPQHCSPSFCLLRPAWPTARCDTHGLARQTRALPRQQLTTNGTPPMPTWHVLADHRHQQLEHAAPGDGGKAVVPPQLEVHGARALLSSRQRRQHLHSMHGMG